MKKTNDKIRKSNIPKTNQEEALYYLANLLVNKYLEDKACKNKKKMVSLEDKKGY